jgi:hypothetical protein
MMENENLNLRLGIGSRALPNRWFEVTSHFKTWMEDAQPVYEDLSLRHGKFTKAEHNKTLIPAREPEWVSKSRHLDVGRGCGCEFGDVDLGTWVSDGGPGRECFSLRFSSSKIACEKICEKIVRDRRQNRCDFAREECRSCCNKNAQF